ncbi:protein Atp12p, mitochondrial [Trichomonascus vanleenenianus]|uniref:ATP synthase complex assembly protein ATP12 n=1 Tax=Trichomonascus vanleenenianus TaxID=2268995 RepID=UPI003EC96417
MNVRSVSWAARSARNAFFQARRGYAIETNQLNETNRAEKTMEKFWTTVGVKAHDDGYAVALDNKPIRTSLGLPLVVPSKTLAHLVAQEWSVIPTSKIRPHALPLTGLAARGVDLKHGNQGVEEKAKIYEHLLPYLDTDTLLVFSPFDECEGHLRKDQDVKYWPVIEEAQAFWGVQLSHLDSEKQLYGNYQSEKTKNVVTEWIRALDTFQLASLEKATMSGKSLIAGMNIIRNRLTVDEISDLVSLEVIHQAKFWGEVEDTYDVNHADIRRNLGSAYIVSQTSRL